MNPTSQTTTTATTTLTAQANDGTLPANNQPDREQPVDTMPTLPQTYSTSDPGMMPPEKALELLMQDPVGFIRRIVGVEAETHLAALKDQAELHGAITAFRKSHPEFQRFESFILQEAATLLQSDDGVSTDSWSKILEKAMDNFKQKLTQTLQESHTPSGRISQPPHVEGAGNRTAEEVPPTFTREQIARMSLQDFLKNESAINDALKNNRIQ